MDLPGEAKQEVKPNILGVSTSANSNTNTNTPTSTRKRAHTSSVKEEGTTPLGPKRVRRVMEEDQEGEEQKKKKTLKEEPRDQVKPEDLGMDMTDDEDEGEQEPKSEAKERTMPIAATTTTMATISKKKPKPEEAEEEEFFREKAPRAVHKPILRNNELDEATRRAMKEQADREERLKKQREKQEEYNARLLREFAMQETKPTARRVILEHVRDGVEIEVAPRLVPELKNHQIEGVQFMWDNCYESTDRIAAKIDDNGVDQGGSGCILAHCMGLGKTLSVIALIHALLAQKELTNTKTVLVLCPLNTAINWEIEFKRWVGKIKPAIELFQFFTFDKDNRIPSLKEWHDKGGVLFMGYDMFRLATLLEEDDKPPGLSKPRATRGGKKVTKRQKSKEDIKLVKTFRHYLRDPGPDLVVCDEGHMIKNLKAATTICVNKIRTLRRIVLTGTPMQNNLTEYYSMIHFVKPNLLGSEAEFNNRFKLPIEAGQHKDSTDADVRTMKLRSFVLHDFLKTTIHRRDFSILRQFLPPKFEYAVKLRCRPMQTELYEKYLQDQKIRPDQALNVAKLFSDYNLLMKVWTHPWLLRTHFVERFNRGDVFDWEEHDRRELLDGPQSDNEDEGKKKKTAKKPAPQKKQPRRQASDEEDEDEDASSTRATPRVRTRASKAAAKTKASTADATDDDQDDSETELDPLTQEMKRQWWFDYFGEDAEFDLALSGKFEFIKAVVDQCEVIGDKLLVFSRSIITLNYFEELLKRWKRQDGMDWKKGRDYFRMDGKVSIKQRALDTKTFNDSTNLDARLFLISTMAGGIGINLFSANRVIILDASWNPAHDLQAMFRSYRLGQKKPVYIYRLMCKGTMEEKIYKRQIGKQAMSQRVVDAQQIARHFTANELHELYRFQPDLHEPFDDYDADNVKDKVLRDLMETMHGSIVSYREHDSLLTHNDQEVLSKQDMELARQQDTEGADYKGAIRGKAARVKREKKAVVKGEEQPEDEEGEDDEDEEETPRKRAPQQAAAAAGGPFDFDEDDDMTQALAMSMATAPPLLPPSAKVIVKPPTPQRKAAVPQATVKEDKYAKLIAKKK